MTYSYQNSNLPQFETKENVLLLNFEMIFQDLVSDEFLSDAKDGVLKAPMTTRITPYLLALMDWKDPANCPRLWS